MFYYLIKFFKYLLNKLFIFYFIIKDKSIIIFLIHLYFLINSNYFSLLIYYFYYIINLLQEKFIKLNYINRNIIIVIKIY